MSAVFRNPLSNDAREGIKQAVIEAYERLEKELDVLIPTPGRLRSLMITALEESCTRAKQAVIHESKAA